MGQPPQPREGDIYGQRNPVDRQRMSTRDWKKLQSGGPAPSDTDQRDTGLNVEEVMAQMAQEGGVSLINFLLQKAVPLHEGKTPSPDSIREWTFRDIVRLTVRVASELPN